MRFKTWTTGLVYQYLLKPVFFLVPPDRMHALILVVGRFINRSRFLQTFTKWWLSYENNKLVQQIFGIKYPNPVGLSAGFDKNAEMLNVFPVVGFGFMEVGSITKDSYEGNPPPHAFRLRKTKSLVVNYGLKNQGLAAIMPRLSAYYPGKIPLNISVAKTNCQATADETCGINDYVATLNQLATRQIGDMYTLNISCPNAFGGEPFTDPDSLERLLTEVDTIKVKCPIFLKMPIDLPWEKFQQLLEVVVRHNVQGVTIGNLTKQRQNIKDQLPEHIKGGLSGLPTQALSNSLIGHTYQTYGQRLVIIGVGGIFSAADAYEKIKRGASLVELITGMIFQGPQLIGQINAGLEQLLEGDGYQHISEAIGAYYK